LKSAPAQGESEALLPGFALRFLPSSSSVVDVPANDWADIMNAGV
jgi:hypothetical protein